ncbi:MAG: hypothetical protein ACRDUW_03225 [Pseudonocardiaceae bacterium]
MTNLARLRAFGSPAEDPAPTGPASAACEVTLRCPSEPPDLLPDAARVLLSILRAVAESDAHRATSPTPRATERERAA